MKIGLITALREDISLPGENFYKRIMANLAPLYLAAFLEKRLGEMEVIIKDSLAELATIQPEILGIAAVTENFEHAKVMAKKAKETWKPITVLGGVHITALPGTLPKSFDVGVVGEGEETFYELLQSILSHHGLPEVEELSKIHGLVFHTPKGIVQTPIRKGINQLDDIPQPARYRYIDKIGIPYLMTSRGCPYTCNFCVIPGISEGYRTHSPEYVIQEIKSIKESFPHIRHIKIFDDLYIVDRRRVAKIADLVDAEGLNQELSFGCWGRANLLDFETIRALKKMNMHYVAFGAESGSSRVMSEIKPGSSIEANQTAIDRLNDNGIKISCSVLLGHPTETEGDLWDTYDFLEKNLNKFFEVEFNVAIPWPGTQLWWEAKKKGLVSEDMDFNQLKEAGCFPNYSTEQNPYLNERISPERFDDIMEEFKKLYWQMARRMMKQGANEHVNPRNEMAQMR